MIRAGEIPRPFCIGCIEIGPKAIRPKPFLRHD